MLVFQMWLRKEAHRHMCARTVACVGACLEGQGPSKVRCLERYDINACGHVGVLPWFSGPIGTQMS